jgi:hypothetical protein
VAVEGGAAVAVELVVMVEQHTLWEGQGVVATVEFPLLVLETLVQILLIVLVVTVELVVLV